MWDKETGGEGRAGVGCGGFGEMVKGSVERSRAPFRLLRTSTDTLSADGWLVGQRAEEMWEPPREALPASRAVVSSLSQHCGGRAPWGA